MAAPYSGWYVVAACATIACFSWGFAFYGLGVYLHVLVRLHGWPTGTISVAVTAYYLIGAVLIIAVGRLIDRHGPRGVLAYGVCAMAGALALLGQITAVWQLFAVYVLLATGWACLSSTSLSATLLPWFRSRQALAMTLALTGASVGGMVIVPALVVGIQRLGFGVAMVASGAILVAILLPLVAFVIKPAPADPSPGADRKSHDRAGSGAPAREWTARQALASPLFWTITVPFALALAAQVGFIVHQISLLTPALGEARAALAVSATTVAALIGRLGFGLLADQWDPRVLSAWNIGILAAALAAMAARPTPAVLYAGSLVVGLAVGNMITLPPILTREEFGSHAFGTIFGMVSAASQAGLAFGPALIGLIRDTRGSYQPALWVLAVLEVIAIAGMLWGRTLRGPRVPLPAR
jgi:MFS family permease